MHTAGAMRGWRGLITGATGGMGFEIAAHCVREGAAIAICGRRADRVAQAVADLRRQGPGTVFGTVADMSQAQQVTRFAEDAVAALGGLDFIVMNAGGTVGGGSLDASAPEWVATYVLNNVQLVLLLQATLPALQQSTHPAVVAITSISGRVPAPRAQYGAAKAATRYVVEALAKELGPTGIRINAVAPGSVLVPGGQWEVLRETNPDRYQTFVAEELPRRRFTTPEDVAAAVAFLLSPAAAGITGVELAVDGGQLSASPNTWDWRRT